LFKIIENGYAIDRISYWRYTATIATFNRSRDKARYWSKIANFPYQPAFDGLVDEDPVGISPTLEL